MRLIDLDSDVDYLLDGKYAVQSVDVILTVDVILAKADEQEKQGFIQTAEVLRDLIRKESSGE